MQNMTPQDFFLNTPLYTKFSYNEKKELQEFLSSYNIPTLEGYNPITKQDTSFTTSANINQDLQENTTYNEHQIITLTCRRSQKAFKFFVYWDQMEKYIMKIGQYPSVADFHIADVKQYDKILKKNKLREFTKAIGLAANGVGIGSFVYLRRIFEDLIEEAIVNYNSDGNESVDFNRKRMAEKIVALKDYLPEFLVDHVELYGILSKGIHELEEDECLAYFETVKVGIELILDEKLENYNKDKKKADAKAKILLASQQIANKAQ